MGLVRRMKLALLLAVEDSEPEEVLEALTDVFLWMEMNFKKLQPDVLVIRQVKTSTEECEL